MKKKRTASSKRPYIFCVIVSLGLIIVLFFSVFMNDPHVLFRLQNILKPVQGEFIFHSLDEDDVSQIYQAQFNTAFDNIRITPLTSSAVDSKMARYSPDGQQIVYVVAPIAKFDKTLYYDAKNGDIMLMTSNGQYQQKVSQGSYARWVDNNHILIVRRIGYRFTQMITECPVYGFFELDLTTMTEKQLFDIPKDAEFRADINQYYMGSEGSRGIGCTRSPYLSIRSELSEYGNHTTEYLVNKEQHPNKMLQASIQIYDPSDWRVRNGNTGIYLQDANSRWILVQAHVWNLSFSPDGQFLIYDAKHPDGNTVIAITAIDGSFTYPLLGSDGLSYSAPHWKPN